MACSIAARPMNGPWPEAIAIHILTNYFTVRGDKIVTLIVIRNTVAS